MEKGFKQCKVAKKSCEKLSSCTCVLSLSHETDRNKLGGTAPPRITAPGSCAIPRCSATELAVACVAVAVNPSKQRTPNFSRRTCKDERKKSQGVIRLRWYNYFLAVWTDITKNKSHGTGKDLTAKQDAFNFTGVFLEKGWITNVCWGKYNLRRFK